MKKGNNRGMTTIEACILIPLIMVITLLIMWLGFLMYNRSLVTSAVAMAAVRGGQYAEYSAEEIEEIAEDRCRELLEGRLICMEIPEISAEVGFYEVTVQAEGNMQVPEELLFDGLYGSSFWDVSASCVGVRLHSSTFVRTAERIRKQFDGINAEEIQENTEEITEELAGPDGMLGG